MKNKTKLLILVTLSLAFSSLSAAIVDGVSLIINKEPITLYEIHKYATRFNLSKKEAMDVLVRQRLEDSEIKKMGISADSFEVDQYIENLAKSNGVSYKELLDLIRSKNIDIAEYKEDLKTKIKRDKLYQKIISSKMKQYSEDELKMYYTQNGHEFSKASAYDVTIYTSADPKVLQALAKNPMSTHPSVRLEEARFEADKTDPKLVQLLNQTAEGSFSTPLNSGQSATMFFVKKKYGFQSIPFDDAKNYIYAKLNEGKEQKAVEEYFEKLKSSATIQVVRAP